MKNRIYGWKRQRLDARDRKFTVTRRIALPSSVDLRPVMPAVYDQGQLGSCTMNAGTSLLEHATMKAGKDFYGSRLFGYYQERVIEGTTSSDAGAELRDAAKVLGKVGLCAEATWPYLVTKFAKAPPAAAVAEAALHRATSYTAIDNTNLTAIKTVLAAGSPVMFGFSVYESFESDAVAKTGNVPMPKVKTEKLLGGHAVVIVGYRDRGKKFLVRNSWGPDWGIGGHFWMPYQYVTNPDLASDFWFITL